MKALGEHDIYSVLITGCNRGIGLGMLKHLAENSDPKNTQLFSCSRRSSPELDKLGERENVHLLTMDVTDDASVKAAVEKVTEILGGKGLALLINNAAIATTNVFTPILEIEPEEMNRLYNVNVTSLHRVTRAFYPLLKLNAHNEGELPMCAARGMIMNFSSITASVELAPPFGQVMVYSYCLTKCAVNMQTKLMAHQFKEDGIMCIAVHPGWVQSDMGALGGDLGKGNVSIDDAAMHMLEIAMGSNEEDHNGMYLKKDCDRLPF